MRKVFGAVALTWLAASPSLAAPPSQGAAPTLGTKQAKQELVGAWTSHCHRADLVRRLIDDEFTRETFSFGSDGTFSRDIFRFADPACRDLVVTETVRGHFSLGFPVRLDGEFGTRELNVRINDAYAAPHDQAAADRLNRALYCGVSTWRKGQSIYVTGRTCEGDTAEEGLDVADLVSVSGHRLYLGRQSFFRTGALAGVRPSTLDQQRPYLPSQEASH